MSFVANVKRGCGTRVAGGIYAETHLSPWGVAFTDFLVDPPIKLAIGDMGLSPVGVKLVPDASGTVHIWDVIGTEHYPDVAGWIEESRRFGISRRLPKTLEFAKLTELSTLVVVHAKAWFATWGVGLEGLACPKPSGGAGDPIGHRWGGWHEPCVGMYWRQLSGGEPAIGEGLPPDGVTLQEVGYTLVDQTVGATDFRGWKPPDEPCLGFGYGIFGAFPITCLGVVTGTEPEAAAATEVADAFTAATESGIEVRASEQ